MPHSSCCGLGCSRCLRSMTIADPEQIWLKYLLPPSRPHLILALEIMNPDSVPTVPYDHVSCVETWLPKRKPVRPSPAENKRARQSCTLTVWTCTGKVSCPSLEVMFLLEKIKDIDATGISCEHCGAAMSLQTIHGTIRPWYDIPWTARFPKVRRYYRCPVGQCGTCHDYDEVHGEYCGCVFRCVEHGEFLELTCVCEVNNTGSPVRPFFCPDLMQIIL